MPSIQQKNFQTLVREQVAAIQGAARVLVDMTVGSILRAVVEANAAVVLWLEGLILQLLATTRAATSNASDLDSWMGDYGLTRLPAVAAKGSVTFSRFTPTAQAVVPVGAVVQTADGTQQYTVTADATNPAYNAGQGGYVLAAGVASVTVPVLANVAAAAGNAAPGAITTIAQAISGVDTVTNALQFTNGADAETDAALRARFIAYVAGLSKATRIAIGNAIAALQTNVSYVIVENLTYAGATQNNYFYIVVDDGSGSPPAGFITAVYNAVDAVRPITSTFNVYAPVVVTANIAMTTTTAAGYSHATVNALVQAAIQTYVNSLPLGATLTNSRLAQLAYDASPAVMNVTGITINGSESDLTSTTVQIIKAGTVTVN
jgi:uncharacterized phage protein gp47/JayE